jgi:hypothetical protein
MRINVEIQELLENEDKYRDTRIVQTTRYSCDKKGRIRWAGNVQRMPETRSVKKVFFRKT